MPGVVVHVVESPLAAGLDQLLPVQVAPEPLDPLVRPHIPPAAKSVVELRLELARFLLQVPG